MEALSTLIWRYHISEFVIESEVELPCDRTMRSPRTIPATDYLTIRRASLSDYPCMLRTIRKQFSYDVGSGMLLEPIRDLTIYVDYKGREIIVDFAEDGLLACQAWIIHLALPFASLVRGALPLHGAGLELEGGHFIGIMAPSKAGKSTLSWRLMEEGARFGCDDIIPIRLEDGVAMAFPGVSTYPCLRIDVAKQNAIDTDRLLPEDSSGAKFWVRLTPDERVVSPVPLSALFLLQPLPEDEPGTRTIQVERLPTDQANNLLRSQLHGVRAAPRSVDKERIRASCARLVERVPIYALHYVRSLAIVPALAEVIQEFSDGKRDESHFSFSADPP